MAPAPAPPGPRTLWMGALNLSRSTSKYFLNIMGLMVFSRTQGVVGMKKKRFFEARGTVRHHIQFLSLPISVFIQHFFCVPHSMWTELFYKKKARLKAWLKAWLS